jgi:hypothetical protein
MTTGRIVGWWAATWAVAGLWAAAAAVPAPEAPALAVVDFQPEGILRNLAPQTGKTLADRLRAHLDPSAYRVLDRAEIERRLKALNLTVGDLWIDPPSVLDFASGAKVRYVLVGRIQNRGAEWEVRARLADSEKQAAGPERLVNVPHDEYPEAALDALLKGLGLKTAAPAAAVTQAAPVQAREPLRLVRAEEVLACRLYKHPRGWEFAPEEKAIEVTVVMDQARLGGRRLTVQEKAVFAGQQLGDSVVALDMADFQLQSNAGQSVRCTGILYTGYKSAERVPNRYISGHRKINGQVVLAWRCTDVSTRQYFYDSERPDLEVSIVFPHLDPASVAGIVYRDWPALPIGAAKALPQRGPAVPTPPVATP